MRNKLVCIFAFLCCIGNTVISYTQNIGINTTGATPDSSAMLDIASTNKGLLIPRMDSTSRKNIVTPAKGLMVFDSTYNSFYFYNGNAWNTIVGTSTDVQDLKLNNDSLFLTNDPTAVDLKNFKQDLSISDDTLTISSGQTSIDLKPYKDADNLGNHTATQDFRLGDHWLTKQGNYGKGISVDASGQVGIGISPNSSLHVQMGVNPALKTITQPDYETTTPANQSFWQSFTAPAEAQLISIVCQRPYAGVLNHWLYYIYEGEGVDGKLLASGTAPVNFNYTYTFIGGNILLKANQKYTLQCVYQTNSVPLRMSQLNPYSGGRCSTGADDDINFIINYQEYNTGFKVENTGVTINDYKLPVTDGTVDQVLSTNGSGIVSWADKTANTDVQQLTISNDSLFLTNDATAINLSPYLDNTDNQQLTISNDSLFITNDTTAISLSPYLDNTDNQQLTISNDSLFITNDTTAISLSPYLDNTDSQQLTLSGNNLSLTNGGTPINLDPYLDADNLGNHTATQNLIIDGNAIQNNASSANGLSMGPENQLLVESDYQRTGYFTTTGTSLMGEPLGNYIEVSNKTGTRSIFGSDGHGLSSPTDTLNTVVGNWTPGGGITFHVSGGVKIMTLDASGRLGIGRTATTNRLEVEGDASKSAAGDWLANSDARLKKNITSLSSEIVLEKMLSLQGVTYEWNDTQTGTKRPEGIQYGFTAQNIQDVFPSLVTEDNNGFLQTPYGTYDAMTVEAIRALNDKIEQLENQNNQLKNQVAEVAILKTEMVELKATISQIVNAKSASNTYSKK